MRVLIATVTAGAGHVQAAAALEEAWKAMSPRDTIQRLDVLEFTPKLYRKMYVEGYVKLVEHAPELWAMVFKKTDNPTLVRKLTRLRRTMAKLTTNKFFTRLKQFKPDVVLCTHYMPLEIMVSSSVWMRSVRSFMAFLIAGLAFQTRSPEMTKNAIVPKMISLMSCPNQ